MTIDGFGLSDDEFWSDPGKNRTEILRGLRREKFDGFIIDGPKNVELARTSLPLTLLRAGSYRQVWSLGYDDGVLVAVDLDRNEVLAVPLRDYEAERPDEPVDLDQAPEGYLGTWVPSDLRDSARARVAHAAASRDRHRPRSHVEPRAHQPR